MTALRWVEAAAAAALALLLLLAVAAVLPRAPSALAAAEFPADFLTRADVYRRVGYLVYAARAALPVAVLLLVARGGLATGLGARLLALSGGRAWLAAGLFAAAIGLGLGLADAPLAWFREFYWARRFGLSTQSSLAFWGDWAKSLAIGTAIEALAVAVLFALAARFPARYWIPAAGLAAFGVWLLALLGPVVLDPLFYRFTALPDSPLRAQLISMAERAGVPVGQVLVADASRRTTAVNAYVAGSGPTRRIVLYDTLLKRYDPDEVELVVAHEIAHVKERHVEKGLALGMAGAAVGVWLLALWLRALASESAAPPLPHPGAVPWVLLLAALASLLVMPLQNGISRRFETQADAVSFRLAPHPEAAVRLERDLALTNLADVDPQPYVEWLLFDHPSQLERMLAARRAAESR